MVKSRKIFSMMLVVILAVITGCSVMRGETSAQQYANDTTITTQIKAKLVQSDMLGADKVHVETRNRIVQLSGFVNSSWQAREAQRIAMTVDGVRGVRNDLVVAPSHSSTRR